MFERHPKEEAVLYFLDDDNIASLNLFVEIRKVKYGNVSYSDERKMAKYDRKSKSYFLNLHHLKFSQLVTGLWVMAAFGCMRDVWYKMKLSPK